MEYYSVIKSGEALTGASTWMKLRDTMVRERSQTQKATCVIPFIRHVQNMQHCGNRVWKQGLEGRGWKQAFFLG
jgi:hypothetical protein